jgi:hypothetical protein
VLTAGLERSSLPASDREAEAEQQLITKAEEGSRALLRPSDGESVLPLELPPAGTPPIGTARIPAKALERALERFGRNLPAERRRTGMIAHSPLALHARLLKRDVLPREEPPGS